MLSLPIDTIRICVDCCAVIAVPEVMKEILIKGRCPSCKSTRPVTDSERKFLNDKVIPRLNQFDRSYIGPDENKWMALRHIAQQMWIEYKGQE